MSTRFSVIIPTYRNSDYLDLCLRSALAGQEEQNQILVVVDGFMNESIDVLNIHGKHPSVDVLELPRNMGMQHALNVGVFNADNEKVFIINDDNVFAKGWDSNLQLALLNGPNSVITVDQVEQSPSMFNFHVPYAGTGSFGSTPREFNFEKWIEYANSIKTLEQTRNGHIFPFIINKSQYMAAGGFDTLYASPFICDWDFFLKLELSGIDFFRTHLTHMYHFGSSATKNGKEGQRFKESEQIAWETFKYKWGFNPYNEPGTNSKIPKRSLFGGPTEGPTGDIIKGINFASIKK